MYVGTKSGFQRKIYFIYFFADIVDKHIQLYHNICRIEY